MAATFPNYMTNFYQTPSFFSMTPMNTSYYYPPAAVAKEQPSQYSSVSSSNSPASTVQYVEPSVDTLRPRRAPRIHRQVIRLPEPAPIYRQVRHRLPTPERKVIERTVVQKANGDVHVQQKMPKVSGKTRPQKL